MSTRPSRGPQTLTADGDITAGEHVVFGDATLANINLTLYPASSNVGQEMTVKKVDSSANTVTVTAASGETIDGAAFQIITGQWDAMSMFAHSDGWYII